MKKQGNVVRGLWVIFVVALVALVVFSERKPNIPTDPAPAPAVDSEPELDPEPEPELVSSDTLSLVIAVNHLYAIREELGLVAVGCPASSEMVLNFLESPEANPRTDMSIQLRIDALRLASARAKMVRAKQKLICGR